MTRRKITRLRERNLNCGRIRAHHRLVILALQGLLGATRSRAFQASYGAAFVFLPWFFRWDLLLRVEIRASPETVLFGAQHHGLGTLLPLV
jgi:hypothetical protein